MGGCRSGGMGTNGAHGMKLFDAGSSRLSSGWLDRLSYCSTNVLTERHVRPTLRRHYQVSASVAKTCLTAVSRTIHWKARLEQLTAFGSLHHGLSPH